MPTKNIALTRPAMPAPACLVTASSHVPKATTVPPSALCVEMPFQSLGPAPTTTATAPANLPDSAAVSVRPLIILSSKAAAVPCPASPCAESSSASLGPSSAPNAPVVTSAHLESDPLLTAKMSTASAIQRAPCLEAFLAGKQHPTVPPPISHHKSPGVSASQ